MEKQIKKSVLLLFAVALMIFGTVLNVQAASFTVKQNGVQANAITVTWDKPWSDAGYTYYGYHIHVGNARNDIIKTFNVPATAKSFKITGLAASREYYVDISCDYKYRSLDRENNYIFTYGRFTTLPSKITGLKSTGASFSMERADFTWTKLADVDGYEYVIKNSSGAVVESNTTYSNSCYAKVVKNKVCTIQVRAYQFANYDRTKKFYGPASDLCYFVPQPSAKGGKKSNKITSGGKMKLKWNKISGASSYTVYVSKKSSSKFKKLKTTKKTSVTLSKFKGKKFKNNTDYHFYIIANKKVGKTTIKSPKVKYWTINRYVF